MLYITSIMIVNITELQKDKTTVLLSWVLSSLLAVLAPDHVLVLVHLHGEHGLQLLDADHNKQEDDQHHHAGVHHSGGGDGHRNGGQGQHGQHHHGQHICHTELVGLKKSKLSPHG